MANLAAIVVWSVVHAAQKQALLLEGAAQADVAVTELERIWKWMRAERAFATLSPIARAQLIQELCVRARTPEEIRVMAVPLAQLMTIFNCEPGELVPRYDQLLRRAGRSATESQAVADTLVRGIQLSAVSFEEMLEAMLAFYDTPLGTAA